MRRKNMIKVYKNGSIHIKFGYFSSNENFLTDLLIEILGEGYLISKPYFVNDDKLRLIYSINTRFYYRLRVYEMDYIGYTGKTLILNPVKPNKEELKKEII